MNTILVEAQYIGSCSYWKHLLNSEKIILDRHEHFVKRSYRNRAHILGANGLLRLSIPLEHGKHQHNAMKDVRISYKEAWQKIHWQSFTSAYRRSPFFEYYEDVFRKFYEEQTELLFDYNTSFLNAITSVLKISLDIELTSEYKAIAGEGISDMRSTMLPGKKSMFDPEPYLQVFSDRFEFESDLCVLDLLFNKGPKSLDYLRNIRS